MKSFVPDTAARYVLRGTVLSVMALWLAVTYITMCHPPLALNLGAAALSIVAFQDFLTWYRMPRSKDGVRTWRR